MKTCTVCKIEKPLSEFHNRKLSKDGFAPHCKQCDSEKCKEYNSKNKDKTKERNAKYSELHREELRLYQVVYRAENPEKVKKANADSYIKRGDKARAYQAARYAANPERERQYQVEYRKLNPDAVRSHKANRRANEKSSGGKLSNDLYSKLFKLQRGHCAICKIKLSHLRKNNHLDHIEPLVPKGDAPIGSNTDDNMQLLCRSCNSKKNNRDPIEYMQSLGYLL